MSFKTTKLRDAITFALAVSATALVGTGAAFAQDTAGSQEEETTNLDRIEVTGSRIQKAELETQQPILTLSRAEIQSQGFTSVADILQNLTSAGSPAISRADALASGEDVGGYYIDIRNLGATRTLVLVNGKRLGVSTSGLQDLGQIPLSAVERIEVLKDGASSIYGSDAIAGVVNVITRRNFEGAEFNGYVGTYDQGDGTKQSYDMTIGATNDRGSITLSAEYTKEDPVFAKDRWFSKYGNSGPGYPFSGWSAVSHNGVWLGNVDSGGNFTPPTCTSGLCTLTKGTDPRNPANYHNLTGAERANANLQMMLATGIERRSIFAAGGLDLTDTMRFRSEIGYTNRSTSQQIAGYPYQYGFGLLSADSYFNPNPAAGDAYWFRRTWEVPRTTRSDLNTFRVALGLEGSLNFGEKIWDWDVGVLSNRNTVNKYQHGDIYTAAGQAALGPSYLNTATGRVECGSAANPIPYGPDFGNGQCIPFNPLLPFGEPGQGSLANPDLQRMLMPEYHDAGQTKTNIISASLAGPLFTLPAGDLSLAVGVEHRKEQGRFVPDAVNQYGGSTNLPAQTTAGSYSLNEVYAELDIPVISGVAFAQELSFNVASRYSKYSNFGSTLNSKFGFRWRPVEGMLFRGTYAQGFRAPAIADLYGGIGGSFESYTDPCGVTAPGSVNGNAACNAAGVPLGYVQLGQANQPCTTLPCQTNFQFLSGSNANLGPETAVSKTLGVVWSLPWVEGLDINLDWFNYKITDTIISDSVNNILDDCYRNGIASRCAGITRNAQGAITNLFFGLTNAGGLRTEGYDFGVNYRMPETSWGKFNIRWETSYTSVLDNLDDNSADSLWEGNVGTPGAFRIRSNLGIGWEMGDWSVNYGVRYYSGMRETCATSPRPCSDRQHYDEYGDLSPINRVGANTFHDLQVGVKLPWNATAAVGANNITDHYGPVMFTAPNSNFPYYGGFDIGRVWYLKYTQKF